MKTVLFLPVVLTLCLLSNSNATVYSSISGKVIGEDTGKGVSGVSVVAFLVGGGHGDRFYAVTDGNGVYAFQDLNAGQYLMGFYKEDSQYVSEDPHVEVVLSKGKNAVNVNHILILGGSVSGTVYNADGTTPMTGVSIYAKVPRSQEWINNSKYRLTDGFGKFLLQGLPESDNCAVEVMVSGHARLTKTIKITKGTVTGNTNFTVTSDDTTGINGYVRSSIDNKPIRDAEVDLRDGTGSDIGYTRTDDTGKFSIVGAPPGAYDVLAFWPEGGDWIEKKNILVEYGKSTVVNFEFNRAAPMSTKLYDMWKKFFGFFVADAFAGGGGDPNLKFEGCSSTDETIIKNVFEAVKKFIRGKDEKPKGCLSLGDAGLLGKLKNKIGQALTIECVQKDCGGSGGISIIGGTKIRLCPKFFELYEDDEDRNNQCPESILLHELVHSVQKLTDDERKKNNSETKKGKDSREREAYACGDRCFTKCLKDDPQEDDWEKGCCN
jgi:hypothetical protein